jgi:hypothetical protein
MEGKTPEQEASASSLMVDVLFLLLSASIMLAIAVGAGLFAAHLRERDTSVNPSWQSDVPITSAALLAELQPPPDMSALFEAIHGAAEASASPPAPIVSSTTPPATTAVSTIQSGTEMTIANLETGGCLNLRDSPSINGRVLQCLPAGQTVRLLAGPREADGYSWWQVDQGGWLAEAYLVPVSDQSVTATGASGNGVQQVPAIAAGAAQSLGQRLTGWATYDGSVFNPADPTIAAASSQVPLHSWLFVCSPTRCIVVQVRDHGALDQSGVLLDLSPAAYTQLFGLPSSDFLSVIKRESDGIPTATCFAPGSDASHCTSTPKPGDTQGAFGPFQFLNSTWNGLGCSPAAPVDPLGVNYAAYDLQASAACALRSYLQSGLSAWGHSGSGGKQPVTVFVIDSGNASATSQP